MAKQSAAHRPVHDPDLAWLDDQLHSKPRGTRSRLARLMERSPDDLSAWLKLLRPIPPAARERLGRALAEIDRELAAQWTQRISRRAQPAEASSEASPKAESGSVTRFDETFIFEDDEQPISGVGPANGVKTAAAAAGQLLAYVRSTGAGAGAKQAHESEDFRALAMKAVADLSEAMKILLKH